MPWKNDDNGERIYIPSMYVKEELPTWSEIYEFDQTRRFEYDPTVDTELDPYWKVPKQLCRLAATANQFNKMIFEDGYKEKIKANVGESIMSAIDEKSFLEFTIQSSDFAELLNFQPVVPGNGCSIPTAATIYTIPYPGNQKNPFIRDTEIRWELNPKKSYVMFIQMYREPDIGIMMKINGSLGAQIIYHTLIMPIRDYFKEPVGWKDENGNPVEKIPSEWSIGSDPAL